MGQSARCEVANPAGQNPVSEGVCFLFLLLLLLPSRKTRDVVTFFSSGGGGGGSGSSNKNVTPSRLKSVVPATA